MFGKLYIVATPIGNLDDITYRAIETIKSVNTILCEDTRVTGKLISLLKTKNLIPNVYHPLLVSYHQHSDDIRKLEILKRLVDGEDLALVTDAGTPSISDPGNELIHYIVQNEPLIQIVPIPGSSSLTSALSICGFDVSSFNFIGFMPKKKKKRVFETAKASNLPLVFFESPNRIAKTLKDLGEYFGFDKEIYVGRELTKMYESSYRGSIKEVLELMAKDDKRGEVVVVLSTTN